MLEDIYVPSIRFLLLLKDLRFSFICRARVNLLTCFEKRIVKLITESVLNRRQSIFMLSIIHVPRFHREWANERASLNWEINRQKEEIHAVKSEHENLLLRYDTLSI